MAFEESFKVVTSVEGRRDFATYVPRDGISLKFLLKHIAGAKDVKDMYDLENYVLGITRPWHCSLTELLKNHPSYKDTAVVERATYFISFAYSTDFETILSALEKYMLKEGGEDIFVWISIFSINQHFGRTEGEEAPVVYPKGWFKKAFKECIPAIKNVLFVMSPLAKPVALQRLWCIYELYLSVSNENCTLDVILSEEDEQYFISNLIKDKDSILEYINGVDAESAKSSNPDQEQKLRDQIMALEDGYNTIDKSVRDALRAWFAVSANGYIEANKEEYKKQKAEYVTLLSTVGSLFSELGKHEESERISVEALFECIQAFGNESEEAAKSLNQLATCYYAQGKYEEAESMQRDAIAILEKVQGEDDLGVVALLSNLAGFLQAQRKLDEAEELFREIISRAERAIGSHDMRIAIWQNALALILVDKRQYAEAETLMKKSLDVTIELLGADHPKVALRLNNMAWLLRTQGKNEEAAQLLRKGLITSEKIYGKEHPDYALKLGNLASVLAAQGKFGEAINLFEESLAIKERVLGGDHPGTLAARAWFAGLLQSQGEYLRAEGLLRSVVEARKRLLGTGHQLYQEALNNLVELLVIMGKDNEAAELFG